MMVKNVVAAIAAAASFVAATPAPALPNAFWTFGIPLPGRHGVRNTIAAAPATPPVVVLVAAPKDPAPATSPT